jgi:selenocysteine lyase/cysteine desulfurase
MNNAAGTPPYDVRALRRSEFPQIDEKGSVYLNCASTGPLPERTRRSVVELAHRMCTPDYDLYRDHLVMPARSREICADLIGAHPDEIAVGANTSFGLNLAASALPLKSDDRVVLLEGEFPANVYPWLNLERRGIRLEWIPRTARGLPDEEAALQRLAQGDVRVFAASAVSFSTGYRLDLETISRECQRHGTYFVVDGIQALGVVPIDTAAVQIDILACGGQKWLLAPSGSGFAYVRRALIDRLDPATVGWLGFAPSQNFGDLTKYAFEPLDDARRFELGTTAFSNLDALNYSLSLLLELGIGCIEEHVRSVQQPLVDWVEARSDVNWVSDPSLKRRSGILSFAVPDPVKMGRILRDADVLVSVREGGIRVATHCFNSREDIEYLIHVLERSLAI